MKKQHSFPVIMCIITLFAISYPVSSQNTSVADEYKETLKKIMSLSGASATTDDLLPKLCSTMKFNVPGKDEAYWNEFAKKWKKMVEDKVMEIYTPVYKKHLTLDELKEIAAFYESPVGEKYKETTLALLNQAMPLLLQELQTGMFKDIKSEMNEGMSANQLERKEDAQRKAHDRELFARAYVLPVDSIVVVSGKTYENGMSTTPSLYSIERRKKDTKVTFVQPIYWDSQWLYFSPGFKIIDKKSGDEYNVRGYDGIASMDRLLVVKGFNRKYIYVSLLFPKLKKSVKEVDILELPHEKGKEMLPSNDDGVAKSFFDIKVKDYSGLSKKSVKVYN